MYYDTLTDEQLLASIEKDIELLNSEQQIAEQEMQDIGAPYISDMWRSCLSDLNDSITEAIWTARKRGLHNKWIDAR